MLTPSEAFIRLQAALADGGLAFFLESSRTLALIVNAQGEPMAWNPAFEQLRQGCPEAANLPELLSVAARAEFLGSLRDVLISGAPTRTQLELGGPTGRARYDCSLIAQGGERLLIIGEPVARADGATSLLEELGSTRAELQAARQALDVKQQELQAVLVQAREVSHTDALTFLPNRRSIIVSLQHEVNRSERYGFPLSVSMIDLDGFKQVNDNMGHAAGDQVLRFIASEMRDNIRQPDEIGRYGGDEFLVVLPNSTEAAAAEQANRLCQQIKGASLIVGKDEIRMSISIGIAQYRQKKDDWRSLAERADQALYEAKRSGGGRWVIRKTED